MLGRLQTALAGRYAIEKELGRGETAIVFLARDLKHDRLVAIKVLQPELGITRERFLREIRVAARLRHARILPLHDSGEADGLLYYVMPYVEGETLATRLNRTGRISLDEATRIVTEVAEGLDYAHKHDVVHRDIKPGNILLEDGHATIADFGIARAIGKAAEDHLTDTGLSIGTPAYMSPEQLAEPEAVGGRSDSYSLGCVVFEMLVGEPPFNAPTVLAAIAKRISGGADFGMLETVGAAHVKQVMAKVLAAEPADRYATAGEFAAALTDAANARESPHATAVAPGQRARSIAVLPFANMSADVEADYFADGMSEELINALTKLESLRVASRTSAFAFKGKDQDIRKIGEQLNVETVLEGSVRKSGSKLRITAQLISVNNGYHLWSERFDRELTDVFAIQDEIACAIVAALQVQLGTAPPKLVKQYTQNLGAYNLYLKGRHFWNRRGEGLGRALQYFEQAVAADPQYAPAYAGIADCHNLLGWYGLAPAREAFPRAKEAGLKALAIDSDLAEAHVSLGFAAIYYDWDRVGAEEHFARATMLNPGYPMAHHWYAQLLMITGRFDQALAEGRRAQELDPLGPIIGTLIGWVSHFARRPDEGIAEIRKTLEIDPDFLPAHFWLGIGFLIKGLYSEAAQSFEEQLGRRDSHRLLIGYGAFANARGGNTHRARELLREIPDRGDAADVTAVNIAYAQLGLGERDSALASLERAVDEHACWCALVGVDPLWHEVAEEPRFRAIIDRIGLT